MFGENIHNLLQFLIDRNLKGSYSCDFKTFNNIFLFLIPDGGVISPVLKF